MPPQTEPHASVYVARQPILDASGRVFGYELLYRAGANETACTTSGDLAAARVFSDALLSLGLDTLTGGRRAFVNVTRQVLLNDLATLLPPQGVVVEILETVDIDEDIINACRQLRAMGYTLALDDYVFRSPAEALIPFVDLVKVDVLTTDPDHHWRIAATVPKRVKLVAEKVESIEAFEAARKSGYHLFQGYYFSKPKTFAARSITGQRTAYVQLLAELNKPNATLFKIEDLIKHDGALSYRVLRCINSAAYGLRTTLHSIRQALVLLGLDQVRKWASVWALAGLNGGANSEIVNLAIVRARSCELIAETMLGRDNASEYFLLGLCSLLDTMLGRPMAESLDELPVSDEVRAALLGDPGKPRTILDAILAYERGHWDEAAAALRTVRIDSHHLPLAYADALKWARELSHSAAA